MKILTRTEIEKLLSIPQMIAAIEEGFVLYSRNETVIPPIASLSFDHPPGDCHIKCGYAKQGRYYVVKIASGFPENVKMGLSSGNGVMLLFDKYNGALLSVLLDEGYLTDMRTAAAGCIAAKYLSPKNISCIGIVGTGAQSYFQLKLLSYVTTCRKVMVWGRQEAKALRLKQHPDFCGWQIEIASHLDHLTAACNLIVTTTSSTSPLLFADQIRPGTHITAIGADDLGKQELDPKLFCKADKIVVDSRSQCLEIGDVSYAIKQGLIPSNKVVELGDLIQAPSLGRTSETEITVADLTGVGIQDLQIAAHVFEAARANVCQ
jgi:ornithine cyclodeaminase